MPTPRVPARAFPQRNSTNKATIGNRVLGVAIDPAKTSHKVLIFDYSPSIIEGPFDIDVFRSGWNSLVGAIERAKAALHIQKVVIGIEASGPVSWPLVRQLGNRFKHVCLFNPLAVATRRKQKLLLGQKTDVIDVAVIGDLLLQGQGYPLKEANSVFAQLQELTYWRHYKSYMVGKLKQQIADRFDKVFPGMTATIGNTRLISDVNRNPFAYALANLGLTPQTIIRLSTQSLRKRLIPYIGVRGRPSAMRIKACVQQMLFPPIFQAKLELDLMKKDMRLLALLQDEISEVEQQMVELVQQTPGKWLLGQIRGLSKVQVASYIGALGDPTEFPRAKEIYSLAGLVPRQHQSGLRKEKRTGVTKAGRKILRTVLFQIVRSVALHEPVFRDYRSRLRITRGKSYRTAQIATANKLNRVLFALMRDQKQFCRGDT